MPSFGDHSDFFIKVPEMLTRRSVGCDFCNDASSISEQANQ
jgi:hypothetical protein